MYPPMNPAEPVTSTFFFATFSSSCPWFSHALVGALLSELVHRQAGAEREAVPVQVLGDPLRELEVRLAVGPVEPDRGDLGDGEPQPTGLGGELETDLESVPAVDPDRADEVRVVRLERVGPVPRAGVREEVERRAGGSGEEALEPRAAHLLAARHVAGGGGDDRAALDESHEVVDLAGVIAAVGHGDDHRGRRRVVDAVPDRVRRAPAVGVDEVPEARLLGVVLLDHGDRRVLGRVDDDEDLRGERHRFEDPVETGDDALAFVVGGDDDGDARGLVGHTATPLPATFQTSASGLSVTSPLYSACGVATISRSAFSSTASRGRRVSSTSSVTYGSVLRTAFALNLRTRRSL